MDTLLTLARELGELLLAQSSRLATAESCTGGLVAAALTEIAGSSRWFERGAVVYSNEAKIEMLGVDAKVIARHGAVSEECALAMAEGMLAKSRATIALSITGVAGPGGGSPGKPVGFVCFGWASANGARAESRQFSGDRGAVRRQSVEHALMGVRTILMASA